MSFDTADQARSYILAHDKRVKQLSRMSVSTLHRTYVEALAAAGQILLYGGAVSKDEHINAIIDAEFPRADEARADYYRLIGA
jgi:uncharacterized protein YciI